MQKLHGLYYSVQWHNSIHIFNSICGPPCCIHAIKRTAEMPLYPSLENSLQSLVYRCLSHILQQLPSMYACNIACRDAPVCVSIILPAKLQTNLPVVSPHPHMPIIRSLQTPSQHVHNLGCEVPTYTSVQQSAQMCVHSVIQQSLWRIACLCLQTPIYKRTFLQHSTAQDIRLKKKYNGLHIK